MLVLETMDLNWRDAPPTGEIIKRISNLFTDLDQHKQVSLCLANSTAKDAVGLYKQWDGASLIKRRNKATKRKFTAATAKQYFHPLWIVATTLINMQIEKQALKSRFIAYKDVQPKLDMKLARVKRLILDMALTIGVHPIALGVKSEASGQISIPQNCWIDVNRITNIFHYNDRDKNPTSSHTGAQRLNVGVNIIPEPVLDLKVKMGKKKPEGRIDAVVVIEHRNLTEVLLEESLTVDNVIVVMTAGFPDSATKEFLHMLSVEETIRSVPFLYFGDHDIPGYSIFQCLKYGSRASAWASPISVCSQLEYVGPTLADLKGSSAQFRPIWEAQYRVDHPRATDSQVQKATEIWQSTVDQKINGKLTALTRKDKEMVKSFRKLGWVQHEKVIQEEIAGMEKGNGVFRFANLAQTSTRYMQQFIEGKLQIHCPERVTFSQPAVAVGSPTTQGFRALSSQSLRVGHPETAISQGDAGSTNQTDVAETLDSDVNLAEAIVSLF